MKENEMTVLEDARAAERGLTATIDSIVRMGGCPTRDMYAARDALHTLITEHEHLLENVRAGAKWVGPAEETADPNWRGE